jgi:hypothetical protein
MDAMAAGAIFPPVVVFYDGTSYWLADGFHRVKATEQSGSDEIVCDLRQGTQQDAQWYSFGANKATGLRRTNDDKHRAVKAALVHANGAQLSNRRIAAHVGVDEATVRNWREKLTAEIPQSTKRTGLDGRTIDVTNIGEADAAPLAGLPAESADGAAAAESPPSAARAGERPNARAAAAERAIWKWCQRVQRAAAQIAKCPVTAKNLAVAIRRSPNSNDLITQLEKTRDFIAAVLAEAGND